MAPIINDYEQRLISARQQVAHYSKLVNRYSLLRVAVFAGVILAVVLAIRTNDFSVLAVLFIILMGCFAWLVARQSRFASQQQYYQALENIIQNEINTLQGSANLYSDGARYSNDKHPYTADLDIFGPHSLYHLLNRAATGKGNIVLAGWLNSAAERNVIVKRQQAVAELAANSDWKLDVQARLLFANGRESDEAGQLTGYLQVPQHMPGEKWLRSYIKIVPFVMLLLLVASFVYPLAKVFLIISGIINTGLTISRSSYINKISSVTGKMGDVLSRFADVFHSIEQQTWQSPSCTELASRIKQPDGNGTSMQIRQLAALISKLNYRFNILVGFVLNVFLLWDIRQTIAIEDWKRSNRLSLAAALDTVAEFEALLSIASLHINQPAWCMPVIAEGDDYTLTAQGIAHPLIKDTLRIANHYELTGTRKIDIITGSNMAGKSTFLRTLGINTVLALCGAPVCADVMQVSVVNLFSYMRIKDSLNESTSTFKAELDRLQMLLTTVSVPNKTFFLIDEMLRGTNSVDKYYGSKAVIEKLISYKAVGLVATHDLQLAKLEGQYPDYIRNFYFDIQVRDNEMLFDYKIKPGECKTFNASMLLQQLGLTLDTTHAIHS